MAKPAKYAPAEKAKLLKKTAHLSTTKAAIELGVTPATVYKWRVAAKATSAPTPDVAPKPIVKANVKVNVKKVAKAISDIQKSLEVLNKYVETAA